MSRLLKTLTLAGVAYGLWAWLRGLLDEPPHPIAREAPVKPAQPAPAASSNGGATTKAELYERAQELGIKGRSKMSKTELEDAIRDAD